MEMVKCMNAVFSQLDTVTDRHKVYKVGSVFTQSTSNIIYQMEHFKFKVETVGKVYMVVAGAPEENKSHVKDIALGINCMHV